MRAGQPWRTFAALYRIHNHRDALVEALGERGIPVRHSQSVDPGASAGARLAGLSAAGGEALGQRCLRARAGGAGLGPGAGGPGAALRASREEPAGSLWDALQARAGRAAVQRRAGRRTDALVAGIHDLRERAWRLAAAELFDALAEWLELHSVVSPGERRYVDRLRQFVRDWQLKSETSRLAEFVEYLDYFVQAGGQINLEQEGGDAVQLMTVHAAKGLEFDHVFVLRLTARGFPMAPRTSVLEFPEALMKEEVPKGDFHIQEERRLFYVALTRARERLTLSTVVHKRSKPSVFLDDILSAPRIARENVKQVAPAVPATASKAGSRAGEQLLFGERFCGIIRRAGGHRERCARPFAHRGVGEAVPAAGFRAAAIERVGNRIVLEMPAEIPVQQRVGHSRGAAGGYDIWECDARTTIRQFIAAMRKGLTLPFEELETIFRREWTSAGFEDDYQEQCYLR